MTNDHAESECFENQSTSWLVYWIIVAIFGLLYDDFSMTPKIERYLMNGIRHGTDEI